MSKEKLEKVCITFRLNEEEHKKLKRYAVACDLSAAEFMRQLCKGNAPQPEPQAEFWELLDKLYEVHGTFKSVFPTILPPLILVKRLRILSWNCSKNSLSHNDLA